MAQDITERWSDKSYAPKGTSVRTFDAVGFDNEAQAVSATCSKFGCYPGQPHPRDATQFVQMGGVSARTNQGPETWIVSATYSYLPPDAVTVAGAGNTSPLQQPTRWRIDPSLESVQVDSDNFGNPLLSSALTPLGKTSRVIRCLTISAWKYYPNFSIAWALRFMNCVNFNPVTVKSLGVVDPYRMKCTHIGPVEDIVLTQPRPIEVLHQWTIRGATVSGIKNDPGYRQRFLDQSYSGWYQGTDNAFRQGDFSEPEPNNQSFYRTRTVPTLLDGTGKPLDSKIKIGEGTSPKSPASAPKKLTGPFFTASYGGDGNNSSGISAYFANYAFEPAVDFSELFAVL